MYRTTKLTSRSGKRVLQTRHLNAFAHCVHRALGGYNSNHSCKDDIRAFARIQIGYQLSKLNPDFDLERWMKAVDGEIETLI